MDFFDTPDSPSPSPVQGGGESRGVGERVKSSISALFSNSLPKEIQQLAALTGLTNSKIDETRLSFVDAIQGLQLSLEDKEEVQANSLSEISEQFASFSGFSEEQADLLNEIKKMTEENAIDGVDKSDDIIAALNLLSESGINTTDLTAGLEDLGLTFKGLGIGEKIDQLSDELLQQRLGDEANRDAGAVGDEPVEESIFGNLLGGFGFIAGQLKGGFDILVKPFKPLIAGFKLLGSRFSFVQKAIEPITNIFGMVGKNMGFLGTVARGVGRAFFLLTAAFDGLMGIFDADKIIGKAKEDLNFLDYVAASISSIISGFTFGLVEAEDVWKFLSENIDAAFMKTVDIVTDFFGVDLVDKIFNFFGMLGEEISNFLSADNLKEMLSSALSFDYKGAFDSAKGAVFGFLGGEGENVDTTTLGGTYSPAQQRALARRLDDVPSFQSPEISRQRYEESMMKEKEGKQPDIIVNTPAPITPPDRPSRRRDLGNIGLATSASSAFN
jgi:hypothetical protein